MLLFRCICHTIHKSFNISLYGCERRFKVMGDISYQLLLFLVRINLLLGSFLKDYPHLLEIPANITYFITGAFRHLEIQITHLDILGSKLKSVQRPDNGAIYPQIKKKACDNKDDNNRNNSLHTNPLNLRNHLFQKCHNIHTDNLSRFFLEIKLFNNTVIISTLIGTLIIRTINCSMFWYQVS